MLDSRQYVTLVTKLLLDGHKLNSAQEEAILHDSNDNLMLVAGPGSGKTTVLVLRALRHVFVDSIHPENLLITTFTRKAAKELRTRWLDYGGAIVNHIRETQASNCNLDRIDLNRCQIDTLDSIAQQVLTEQKVWGGVSPTLIDNVAAKLLFKRARFGEMYFNNGDVDNLLKKYLTRFSHYGKQPQNATEALNIAKLLSERIVQDCIDVNRYRENSDETSCFYEVHSSYLTDLSERNLVDFATLELKFLDRIRKGLLVPWVEQITAMLIDEYQDTNPLQEAIYFELMRPATVKVTLVGDDDQSMYRFRGSSVELFTQFEHRCKVATGRKTSRIDLITNYRSTPEIVDYYNKYVTNDPGFQTARLTPPKNGVVAHTDEPCLPVLGIFRETPEALAESLVKFIDDLISQRQKVIATDSGSSTIEMADEGKLGDFVYLAHSVNETSQYDTKTTKKFPSILREKLEQCQHKVFNPRGQKLREITSCQRLLGLILLCLDPDNRRSGSANPLHLTNVATQFLTDWRQAAREFIAHNPCPRDKGGIKEFINKWQSISRGEFENISPNKKRMPKEWPLIDLAYKLLAWIPEFQNDPEHQVWLEAILRTISSAAIASPYKMQIFNGKESTDRIHNERSRDGIVRDALVPIALDETSVDEDIVPSVPRDYFQVMTIHQSKGLEFPVVIVDVGSSFKTNHKAHRFKRFPDIESSVVKLEDEMDKFNGHNSRSIRPQLDRTFDDLVRLYYVAFSRPQSLLILVGLEKCLEYGKGKTGFMGGIPNIALGWQRSGNWPWRQDFEGSHRPPRVNTPFTLI